MKEIVDWVGYYITEEGKAISDWGHGPQGCSPKYRHTLNPSIKDNGYLHIILCKRGKRCVGYLHRLVAEAFIPNPLGLPDVNHKNEDKTDNRVENLEWVTHKDNCNHGTRNERMAKALRGKKQSAEQVAKKSKPVVAYIYESGEFYGEYPSIAEASRQLGLSHSNISSCCNGKYKHTGDFAFRYK